MESGDLFLFSAAAAENFNFKPQSGCLLAQPPWDPPGGPALAADLIARSKRYAIPKGCASSRPIGNSWTPRESKDFQGSFLAEHCVTSVVAD